jgi:hypothetical protein
MTLEKASEERVWQMTQEELSSWKRKTSPTWEDLCRMKRGGVS